MTLLSAIAFLATTAAAQSVDSKPTPKLGPVKVTISKETTYLTGPLRPDGWIDFAAVINKNCGEGVTAENNAAVPFWRAVGGNVLLAKTRVEFFRQLKSDVPPDDGSYLKSQYEYLPHCKEHPATSTPQYEAWEKDVLDQLEIAKSRPWKSAEFPVLAGWLEANSRPLALICECTKRQRFFEPLIVAPDTPIWKSDFAPELTGGRCAVELLRLRAMQRLAEGKTDDAWQDLLTCHRLARLLAQRPLLINALISYALDQFASDTDAAFVQHAKLTPKDLLRCRRELAELPALPSARASLFGERLCSIDFLRWVAGGDSEARDMAGGFVLVDKLKETRNKLLADRRVDWDIVFRAQIADFDETDKALQLSSDFLRREELKRLERTSREAAKKVNDPAALTKLLGSSGTSVEISQKLATVLLGADVSGYSGIVSARMTATVKTQLTDFAIALTLYHHDHNAYPPRLADLAPTYIAELPRDPFSNRDYVYHLQDGGYTLYSVGRNGRDDHGANAWADHLKQFENEGDPDKVPDDLCIRSPKEKP
jgi:hypothetical protein